jgi:hypothetical protein
MATKNPHNMSVGATVWRNDRSANMVPLKVASETTRSWILSDGVKVPKTHADPVFRFSSGSGWGRRYCLTREAAETMALEGARWKMSAAVTACKDLRVLRLVAEALGMDVRPRDVP